MKNKTNYTDSELEDLRVVSREIMDAEIEAIRAEVEAEREHARIGWLMSQWVLLVEASFDPTQS